MPRLFRIFDRAADQAAEAEIDLLRIRTRASRYNAILGNPEARLDDHSEFNEELAELERYERRAFARRKRAFRAMLKRYPLG